MYCPQCGSVNDDSARFCMACGIDMDPYRQRAQQARPVPAHQQEPGTQQQYQASPYPLQAPVPDAPVHDATPSYAPREVPSLPREAASARVAALPQVKSYLGWAIATLILCFWPTGIVAVVHATRVGNRLGSGDYPGAQESSRKAKYWSQISFNIALAFVVVAVVFVILTVVISRN